MNGLIIFLGASFRLGNQCNTNIGSPESYDEQIKASISHIVFMDYILKKYNLNKLSVFVSSYQNRFEQDLLNIYKNYLVGHKFYTHLIGLNNLFHETINNIDNIQQYDFVFYIRIDIFLKQLFMESFNPMMNTIVFPTICFIPHHKTGPDPRVNDVSLFIPKKYYPYFNRIDICHDSWHLLVRRHGLNYNDLDVMINTYHDSDSHKDFNPLYYIVNRSESNIFHSNGHFFNKHCFH
jgi:hypothetical protein